MNLAPDYEIRLMSGEEFGPLWKEYSKEIFDETQLIFRPYSTLTDSEREKADSLGARLKDILRIRLGLFYKEEFVGWSWGFQESAESFYMCNSAVFPEHRRKGLYTALMNQMLNLAIAEGFQHIYSRHTTTNNAVIIPKLKAGFFITNLEVSDKFGTLVHLSYYPSPLRRKILNFRAGQMRPDNEVSTVLGI